MSEDSQFERRQRWMPPEGCEGKGKQKESEWAVNGARADTPIDQCSDRPVHCCKQSAPMLLYFALQHMARVETESPAIPADSPQFDVAGASQPKSAP